jgi:hypothetical protein
MFFSLLKGSSLSGAAAVCYFGILLFGNTSICRAQGGPPLITDDTGTPGNNNWEINVAATSELRHPASRQFETPLLDINYGIGKNIELNYQLPMLLSANRDETNEVGLGDFLVGVKWRFLDEEKAGLSASFFPQFTFNNPTSSVRRELVANDQDFLLPLELQKTVGPIEINFEAGPDFHFNTPNEWDYGLAIGHSFGALELLGEIHGTALDHFQEDDLVLNVGARYQIAEHYALLLSVGRSIHDDNTARATFLSYTGIQFTF